MAGIGYRRRHSTDLSVELLQESDFPELRELYKAHLLDSEDLRQIAAFFQIDLYLLIIVKSSQERLPCAVIVTRRIRGSLEIIWDWTKPNLVSTNELICGFN